MKLEEFEITIGENAHQTASLERNEKTLDYDSSRKLSYLEILSIVKGLDVISEFFDVNAVVTTTPVGICAVSLGKSLNEAMLQVMDSNPIDFLNAVVTVSTEVDSDVVKMLKATNLIVAPAFTRNAIEFLERHDIAYVTINTPLKDYKKYLSNEIKVTPLGTLTETPNLSELNKDTFKVVSKTKPTVEQIEDAVFAWKVAKHASSRAIVVAKDLKTSAISQGLQSASVEFALDYSCDMSKEAVIAFDTPITVHDINVAAQGRISVVILPAAQKEVVDMADKFNIAVIVTGITNILS